MDRRRIDPSAIAMVWAAMLVGILSCRAPETEPTAEADLSSSLTDVQSVLIRDCEGVPLTGAEIRFPGDPVTSRVGLDGTLDVPIVPGATAQVIVLPFADNSTDLQMRDVAVPADPESCCKVPGSGRVLRLDDPGVTNLWYSHVLLSSEGSIASVGIPWSGHGGYFAGLPDSGTVNVFAFPATFKAPIVDRQIWHASWTMRERGDPTIQLQELGWKRLLIEGDRGVPDRLSLQLAAIDGVDASSLDEEIRKNIGYAALRKSIHRCELAAPTGWEFSAMSDVGRGSIRIPERGSPKFVPGELPSLSGTLKAMSARQLSQALRFSSGVVFESSHGDLDAVEADFVSLDGDIFFFSPLALPGTLSIKAGSQTIQFAEVESTGTRSWFLSAETLRKIVDNGMGTEKRT